MDDPHMPIHLTENEFRKLILYRQRLIAILERDGKIEQFRGSTDYMLRSVIEALGLSDIFYDAPVDDGE